MKIKILTLFPNMFEGFLSESIIKRAIEKGVVTIEAIDMRTYSLDKHHHVDDTPCGGGAGMVLACDVVDRAIKANSTENSYKILMTPQGRSYNQQIALDLAKKDEIVLICGHYEGFDERITTICDYEISIGDYVLTGGEIPAMAIVDSITRLLPGVINEESHREDSFKKDVMNDTYLLDYPTYTKPADFRGLKVPEVLISGHHENIRKYRYEESLKRTRERRPDLLEVKHEEN